MVVFGNLNLYLNQCSQPYQEVTPMNKSKILLLSLTFLFLFSSSVFGEGKKEYYDNGKFWSKGPLKSETPYNGLV
jgi:hypothetical protein